MQAKSKKIIALNRKARHDYSIEKTFEVGIALVGTEVKSLRMGGVNLRDSFCYIEQGEIFVNNMHISPYEKGNIFNQEPMRKRKLLMHKREILNLFQKVRQQGYSLIPLSLYFYQSKVKMEVGLCKGKKTYDKRADIAKRDATREMQRAEKQRFR